MSDLQEYLKEQLEDPCFQKEWDNLEPEFNTIQAMIDARKRCNLTQKELAERINTTEATLARYVSGDREPKADMLANIATALHTTSDYLLGIEPDDFDFPKVERLLARNAATMSEKQKRALISALFGED